MRPPRTWVIWIPWTVTVALVAISWLLPQERPLDNEGEIPSGVLALLLTIQALGLATVGLVIGRAQPRHAIARLFAGSALFVAFYLAAERYQYFALVIHHGDLPLGTAAAWVQAWVYVPALAIVVNVLPQLFPDGHVVSPRWRFGLWLAGFAFVGICAIDALAPGIIGQSVVPNPFGVDPEVHKWISVAAFTCYLLSTVVAFVSMLVRWRRADRRERQQLKLFLYAASMLPVFVVASGLVNQLEVGGFWLNVASFLIATVAFLGLPVATAISILRHRLYDIDLVINRTLVYAVLTTLLVATYLVSVLVLGAALDPLTGSSDLAVAASTLAAAGLFRPLRTRVQAVVDRRFYRSRYDAARTLDSFTDRLRHEVDLVTLGHDLQLVVADTMQPEHVSLWLREVP